MKLLPLSRPLSCLLVPAANLLAGGLAVVLLTPSVAHAAPDARAKEARTRFDRALQLFDEKDYAGALAEFLRANELAPNTIVLYDIAQCYEALGRQVDAQNTLKQLIAHGPNPSELARANAMLIRVESRIGSLRIEGGVAGAQLEIDGIRVGTLPLSAPIPVTSGARILTVIATGYAPYRAEVVVAGQAESKHEVTLLPTEARLAHLEVKANVASAQVRVGGQAAGTTPLLAPLTLLPGAHDISISRPGYLTEERKVTLGDGATGRLDVRLREDAGAARSLLNIEVSEPSPIVYVDDEPRGTSLALKLPEGVHRVRIEHAGFLAAERDVTLSPGGQETIRVRLLPTPETRAAYESSVRKRKIAGWTLIASGALIGGAGAVLTVLSANRVTPLKNEINDLSERIAVGSGDPCSDSNGDTDTVLDCKAQRTSKEAQLTNVRTRQTIGIVGASVGGAALVAGVVVLLTTPSASRFESAKGRSIQPIVTWQNGGGMVGAVGTF